MKRKFKFYFWKNPGLALGALLLMAASSGHAVTSKVDLQISMVADACTTQTLQFKFRIYNWETTALNANTLFLEGYFFDPSAINWNFGNAITAYTSAAVWQASTGYASAIAAYPYCAADGTHQANQKITLTMGAVNIPPNGGYIESDVASFYRAGWPTPFDSGCDDFSKPGAAAWHSDQNWALFQNAPGPTLVCEYSSASTMDPLSGRTACNGFSACSPPTATPTVTSTFTPAPTATRTPALPLTKSSNVSTIAVGQTLTYCVAWTNDSGSPLTRTFYDQLAAQLTWVGGDPGCSATGQLVTCSFAAGAGASGSKCFWAVVNAVPP